jgi:flagellin-specific chaperone FliS
VRIKIKQRDIEKFEEQLEKYAAIRIELNEQKDYLERDISKATDDLNKVMQISNELNQALNNNALKLKEPFFQPITAEE